MASSVRCSKSAHTDCADATATLDLETALDSSTGTHSILGSGSVRHHRLVLSSELTQPPLSACWAHCQPAGPFGTDVSRLETCPGTAHVWQTTPEPCPDT